MAADKPPHLAHLDLLLVELCFSCLPRLLLYSHAPPCLIYVSIVGTPSAGHMWVADWNHMTEELAKYHRGYPWNSSRHLAHRLISTLQLALIWKSTV